jgi:2-hydroxy-6-oxonona-2,4-dienedioate hydrolase
VNLDQEIAKAQHKAQRLQVQTASGLQVWHAWNASAGNPLVLLHGGSGSWNHWVRNVLPLSENRAVWALDTPGMGDSELPPGAQDADDLAQPLAQGMRVLFNDEPVDTVGFSFGGLMAGFLAAQQPALIKRLVLVGVPGLGLSNNITNMRGFRVNMTHEQRLETHRNNLLAIMLHDEKNITPDLLAMQEHNVLRDRLRRRRIARSNVLLSVQKHWACQVHGIWGERDALYEGSLHLIPQLLSTCDLKHFDIIEGAGHWVQFEAPDAFNQNMMRNLAIS